MPSKCSRCPEPAVRNGLCARHVRTPTYVPKNTKPRKRTPRKREYALKNDPIWAKLSKGFLSDNPWCVRCQLRPLQSGGPKRTVATHVDHIFPAQLFPEKHYDAENWQALCKSCHGVKGTHERAGRYYDYARGIIHVPGEIDGPG